MSIGLIGTLLNVINGPLGTVVEKYFDNQADRDAFKNAVELEVLKNQKQIADQAGNIVLAEAQSEHKITAIWRPVMMLIFVSIIAIHLLIVPYILTPALWLIGVPIPELMPIPEQVWTLLSIGIGGYVGGRSIEKAAGNVAKAIKRNKQNNLEDY